MGAVQPNRDLFSRVEMLERQVAAMERTTTLTSASISEGDLTVRRGGSIRLVDRGSLSVGEDASVVVEGDDEDSEPILTLGNLISSDGQPIGRGMYLQTRDGRYIAVLGENGADEKSSWVAFYDGHGAETLATDRATGYGMALPRFSTPWTPARWSEDYILIDWPDWRSTYDARVPASHPFLQASFDTGSSGAEVQVRLVTNGVVAWTSPAFTGARNFTETIPIHTLPNVQPRTTVVVQLQTRRLGGVGNHFIRATELLSVGTPHET